MRCLYTDCDERGTDHFQPGKAAFIGVVLLIVLRLKNMEHN